jgi:hypothetical protein
MGTRRVHFTEFISNLSFLLKHAPEMHPINETHTEKTTRNFPTGQKNTMERDYYLPIPPSPFPY